jgi:hypothetical protein
MNQSNRESTAACIWSGGDQTQSFLTSMCQQCSRGITKVDVTYSFDLHFSFLGYRTWNSQNVCISRPRNPHQPAKIQRRNRIEMELSTEFTYHNQVCMPHIQAFPNFIITYTTKTQSCRSLRSTMIVPRTLHGRLLTASRPRLQRPKHQIGRKCWLGTDLTYMDSERKTKRARSTDRSSARAAY